MKYKKDWAEDWNYCRACHTTEQKHVLDGYCQACFKKMDKEVTVTKSLRPCLVCHQSFYSYGPENRRCEICDRKPMNFNSDRYKIGLN